MNVTIGEFLDRLVSTEKTQALKWDLEGARGTEFSTQRLNDHLALRGSPCEWILA